MFPIRAEIKRDHSAQRHWQCYVFSQNALLQTAWNGPQPDTCLKCIFLWRRGVLCFCFYENRIHVWKTGFSACP